MTPCELHAFDDLLTQAPAGPRIEFGVFHGDALRRMAAHDGDTIGVDSFEGMPEPTERDTRDGSHQYPRGRLKADPPDVPGARLVKGWVPDVLAELPDGPYAFAHVDMDQYDSTLAALRWLRPRMAPGGIICCDDWFADRDWLAAGAINALARDWPLTGTEGRKAWWVCSLRDRCTELLGEGQHRRVYVHPDNPDLVVKIAAVDMGRTWIGAGRKGSPPRIEALYSNPGEWAAWHRVQGTDLERWFCPCVSISEDGIELVQHRAKIRSAIPPGFPEWLLPALDSGHTKPGWQGFGLWSGALRLVDYADPDVMAAIEKALRP